MRRTSRITSPLMIWPLALLLLAPSPQPLAEIEVAVERLRNSRGLLHFCLSNNPRFFPDCSADPNAIKRTIKATEPTVRLQGVPTGDYALTVLHDENRNGRLDTMLGIPREGFGFSRNPKVRFGAPKFEEVRITVAPGYARQAIRLQYLL
jgi:uncharacterized protein (DUF2141 family)